MSKQTFTSIEDYISSLIPQRQEAIQNMRNIINKNIPTWFQECINYGMIGWVVPHSKYPDWYHCNPSLPLPFMNLASQKNHIWLYTMWLYSDKTLMEWFVNSYQEQVSTKLDMGKSCIRFKKLETIPYKLIWELASKMTVNQWIEIYEKSRE